MLRDGKEVCDFPSIERIREVRQQDLGRLDSGVRRLLNPYLYHVSLSGRLWDLKQDLIRSAQEGAASK